MANGITGTPVLSATPTNYSFGASSQLSPAIQTIWSKEILFQSMPILRFEQFAVKKTELGVQPGLTINFMRYNNLGVIDTTQVAPATNLAGAGGVTPIYRAIFLGDNAFGHAISLPVELRDGGILDFGREHALAWYAIWGLGLITDQSVVIAETN
jgi:hypothetical protein